jgi:hypothetical protein
MTTIIASFIHSLRAAARYNPEVPERSRLPPQA